FTLQARMETLPADTTSPDEASGATRCFLAVAFDADRPLGPVSRHDLREVDEVVVGRGAAREVRRAVRGVRRTLTISLADPRVSQPHARLTKQGGAWRLEDAGSSNGTRLDGEACTTPTLLTSDACIEVGHTFLVFKEYEIHEPTEADVALSPDARALAGVPF